jgi:hypothetical protein
MSQECASITGKSKRRFLFTKPAVAAHTTSYSVGKKVKVKLGSEGFNGLRIFKHSAHEGDKAVSPMHRPLLSGRIQLINISKTPSGIEYATFRLVAQCLNLPVCRPD